LIGVDTNILVYAHREDSPFHEAASRCVGELAEGSATWTIPWPCLHEFIAIVTHPRIYAPPTRSTAPSTRWTLGVASPTLALLTESAAHWPTLRGLLAGGRIAGAQVHDARVAALCRQHGVRELWSADRDFSRFAGLAVVNPLLGS